MDDGGIDLICMRLAEMAVVHPRQDSTSHVCAKCEARVGIYPSGQEILTAFPGRVRILCYHCRDGLYDLNILAPGAEFEPFESIIKRE